MSEQLAMVGVPQIESSAVFSADGVYRYSLLRRWDARPIVVSLMLNPSKAGAQRSDPTTDRNIGHARAMGAGGLVQVNMYALVSTDPRALLVHPDPVGPANDAAIRAACAERRVICAWGCDFADRVRPGRVAHVVGLLRDVGAELYALTDRPLHPLARVAGLSPRPWSGP